MAKDSKKEKVAYISLEDLKAHLKSLMPNLKKGEKIPEVDEKAVNFLLDLYLWAEKGAGN